jgi:LCP family protein required for cell wall assembly
LFLGLSAIVSCAVFLVVAFGYGATRYYDTRLTRTDIAAGRVEGTRPPAVPHGRETWLLVGSDVRTGADQAEVGGARSDTMMIAYLGSNGSTTLVSVPRDLKVTIPAFTDSSGTRQHARTDKVNAALELGGPALLLRTLENVANVRIDHFAEIDFGGFRQMSTVLGGVTVCLVSDPYREYVAEDGKTSTNLNDPMSGFRGQVGTNQLEGDNALAFVRQRHGFADGDYTRIERQQAFLAAVFRKVNSGDLLTDPAKLAHFLGAITGAVTIDSGTDLTDLRTLALRLHSMSASQVQFTTIPLSGAQSSPIYYALYDPDAVRSFFQRIIAEANATPGGPPPSPTAAPSPTLAPAQIRVTVLHGSASAGTATKVAAKLRAAGYQVSRVTTSTTGDVAHSLIQYPPGQSAAADRLLADIPGATVAPAGGDATGGSDATAPGGGATPTITLTVGDDLVDGDISVLAAPSEGTQAGATPEPFYTQAPVSAVAGCIK